MNFDLTEDQLAFQQLAKDFAEEQMMPHAKEWDETSFFPADTLRKAASLGFGGIYVKDDVGGSGLTRFDSALIFEQLARACPSTAAFLSIHNMASWMIDCYGSDYLRAKYLPSLTSCEKFASYCLTEPNAGSDAASLQTKAVLSGDKYILNGSKAFISGGGVSDIYVVMARTGGEGAKGVSTFIVEKGAKGLSYGAQEKKMGWKSQPTSMVIFDNCEIPVENLIATEGMGFKIAMAGLDGGRLNIAACSLGGASYALERTLSYVQERKQFGSKLADFQALRFRIADMATELEAARLLLYKAANAVSNKEPNATAQAAMAKRFVTDICFNVANEALQLHGGYGYLQDYPLERLVRDLRVHQILEGTNEIMRVVIARSLLGA